MNLNLENFIMYSFQHIFNTQNPHLLSLLCPECEFVCENNQSIISGIMTRHKIYIYFGKPSPVWCIMSECVSVITTVVLSDDCAVPKVSSVFIATFAKVLLTGALP